MNKEVEAAMQSGSFRAKLEKTRTVVSIFKDLEELELKKLLLDQEIRRAKCNIDKLKEVLEFWDEEETMWLEENFTDKLKETKDET